jgi:hypothetical protein
MKKLIILSLAFFKTVYSDPCLHYVTDFNESGILRIEDGSKWQVHESDIHKLEAFKEGAFIFRADENWFSSDVKCSFINKINNTSLNVALLSPPEGYAEKSHWIAFFEPKKSILFLDNGSIFSLYDNDREYFKNWLVDDFVITGDYESWMTQSKHILFNYRTKEFIFGELHQ